MAQTKTSTATPRDAETRPLFGVRFTRKTFAQVVDETAALPAAGQGVRLLVTANLDHVVNLRRNAGLVRAYDHAWWRTIDGTPVFLYAKLRKLGVPDKVTGADLLPALLDRFRPGQHRPFFVVATEEIGAGLRSWGAGKGFDPEAIGVVAPPFGFEQDAAYSRTLAERIRVHGTTHLLFGVGAPKSEIWIDTHSDRLGDCCAFGVGAALGFFTGDDRRAPSAVRKIGMEWLWRVGQEPRRLARRYFVQSWGFLAAIAGDLRQGGASE
jgi:N-acetylglucosaminyldiphosphoundecaprenol N-acetyl-beta-D-mannosaminyltransferase